MFKVIETSTEEDLAQFSRLLWQKKISHRVHSVKEGQILTVPKQKDIPEVHDLYARWRAGQVSVTDADSTDVASYFDGGELLQKAIGAFYRAPATISLIIICIGFAFATRLGADRILLSSFLYPDFSFGNNIFVIDVLRNLTGEQFLRLISPMLLHFSLMHIVFNMLWLWELGKRIEAVQASWAMLLLVIVLAVVSNTVQYIEGGTTNFGGMSGVVYGLFAYCWMWQLFDPAKRLGLPVGLIFFMLLMLGIMTFIGFESIADAAHIGGLICGIVYGAAVATISRIQRALKTKTG